MQIHKVHWEVNKKGECWTLWTFCSQFGLVGYNFVLIFLFFLLRKCVECSQIKLYSFLSTFHTFKLFFYFPATHSPLQSKTSTPLDFRYIIIGVITGVVILLIVIVISTTCFCYKKKELKMKQYQLYHRTVSINLLKLNLFIITHSPLTQWDT